jgi:tetratricopeptide (TPR) repeat protein
MSQSDENPPPGGGKRKIIHWNPEEEGLRSSASAPRPRGIGFYLALGSGFVAIAAVAVLSTLYLVRRGDVDAAGGEAGNSAEDGAASGELSYDRYRFVSRERVERIRAEMRQEITAVRKVTDDHPRLIQELVALETQFDDGNKSLTSGAYPAALKQFERVGELVNDLADLIALRQAASAEHDKFLTAVENVEGSRSVAPYEYEKAVIVGSEGEVQLSNGNFTVAQRTFVRAIETVEAFEKLVDIYFADLEIAGKIALNAGDADKAKAIFRDILKMQPDNELAQRNLKRAETVDRVLPLLVSADESEDRGDLEAAFEAFEKAFALDPQSARAQQGKSRVGRTIEDNRFEELMTTAGQAEKTKDWDTAITTYTSAVKEFPDRTELKDLLKTAKKEGHKAKVEAALYAAIDYEDEYRWANARDTYLEVLDLDEYHEEGLAGLKQAGSMLRVLLRYQKYIEDAQELAAKGEFQRAIQTFNETMAIKPSYLQLTPEIQELKDQLSVQSQPIYVSFVSDGRTWVSIAGYKMIGKFTQYSTRILPGNYRVRGRRKGFQDVLLEVRIRNGRQIGPIKVVCYKSAN